MDPELRSYLDALRRETAERFDGVDQRLVAVEQSVATKADLDALRVDVATKADLDEMLDAMQAGLRAEIRAGDEETRRVLRAEILVLEAKVDAQGRELHKGLAEVNARLIEGLAERKQDEDLALKQIRALRPRVKRLERRVDVLERRE